MSIDITTLRPKLEAALGEELQLGERLGQGGFAAVFRAHDGTAFGIMVCSVTVRPSGTTTRS